MYEINKWNEYFENNESRKLKHLRWFPCPNKFDGLTYRKIANQTDATELFCAWILLLEIASKSEPRGILGKSPDSSGYSPEDMELMTGFPAKIFKKALNFFSDNDIQWITNKSPDVSGNNPDVSGKSPAVLNVLKVEKEKNNTNTAPSAVSSIVNQKDAIKDIIKNLATGMALPEKEKPKEGFFLCNGQKIGWGFFQKVVNSLKGDKYQAALVFYRAEANQATNVIPWIMAGLTKGGTGYATTACKDEYDNPRLVKDWIHKIILKDGVI